MVGRLHSINSDAMGGKRLFTTMVYRTLHVLHRLLRTDDVQLLKISHSISTGSSRSKGAPLSSPCPSGDDVLDGESTTPRMDDRTRRSMVSKE